MDNTEDDDDEVLIDGETEHESTIGYQYGYITSVKQNNQLVPYAVTVETFNTVFASPLDESVQTYAFENTADGKPVNVLKYNNAVPVNLDYSTEYNTYANNISSYLKATNKYDDTFNGYLAKAGNDGKDCLRKKLYLADNTTINGVAVSATAKLISNETGKEDYFTAFINEYGYIFFTPKSATTPPTGPVNSTLILSLYDCFGQEQVYELPFTVTQ